MKPYRILVTGTISMMSISALQAAAVWFDVTAGGTASGTSGNFPTDESPPKTIDGNYYTKYLNFDELNTGVIISGGNAAVPVTRMTLVTANDASERDPASYTLEGSNDGSNWTGISSGGLALPTGRNTVLSGDHTVYSQSLTFSNDTAYSYYRVIFPTVRNSGAANSMQIGEISLLGLFDPGTSVTELQPFVVGAYGSGTYPGGESPAKAVDNDPSTKYLNFGKEGNGLTFSAPTGNYSLVTALTLSQADDAPARDVASFTLRGSTDGINFTDIVTNQPIGGEMGMYESDTVSFANSTPYRDYQFVVTGLRSSGNANSFQFGELQLHGTLVPEPTFGTLGLLGTLAFFRRRK
ncbi:MAG: hypothetical protein J0M04_08305 [Verrucomicrobia bacterium]|nr:hypothetical protein [Verrucomicrobiota bacterium]